MKFTHRSDVTYFYGPFIVASLFCTCCTAAIHKDTNIKYVGETARIYVPNTWETVGSGYVANAPLEELSSVLKRKPKFKVFRIIWKSFPGGFTMSGSALYIRSKGTLELHHRSTGTEGTDRSHIIYEGVTDAKIHTLAKVHSIRPTDRAEVSENSYFDELVNYGCKKRVLYNVF